MSVIQKEIEGKISINNTTEILNLLKDLLFNEVKTNRNPYIKISFYFL